MEFPTTHWSQLALATLHGDSGAGVALAAFYRRYRDPVRHFIERRGIDPARAEDLTHDFFLHVIEKSTLGRADAARGRFRTFLLGALVRFLGDVRDRENAGKRGGGRPQISLDAVDGEWAMPSIAPATVTEFDREWAIQVLGLALEKLEVEYATRGKTAQFAVLRAYVPGGLAPLAYDAAAARLGISVAALKTEVHRLRQRFRGCLREELAPTVSSPAEIDGEIAYLGRVLQSAGALAAER